MKKKQILGLINDKLSKIVDILDKKNIIEYPWTSYDQKQLNDLIEESDKAISVTISGTPETGVQIEKGKGLSNYMPGKCDSSFNYRSNKPWSNEDRNKKALEELSNELNESKYYTPSIEEFYVGFEYEREYYAKYPQKEGWTWSSTRAFSSHIEIASVIASGEQVRVKYLDKEDIKSLGFEWKCDDEKNHKIYGLYGSTENTYKFYYQLQHNIVTNNVMITRFYNEEKEYVHIFNGIIKNKSELIKILNMIGYEK